MVSSSNKGFTFLQPMAAPVLAFPLEPHLLVESRADLRGFYQQNDETRPFSRQLYGHACSVPFSVSPLRPHGSWWESQRSQHAHVFATTYFLKAHSLWLLPNTDLRSTYIAGDPETFDCQSCDLNHADLSDLSHGFGRDCSDR